MRAVFVSVAVLTAAPALADVVQTQTIAPRPAGWSGKFTYAKADPAQGALTSVTLGLTGTLGGTLQIENRDAALVGAGSFVLGTVTARLPDGQPFVSAQPVAGANTSLGAFDGTVDFAGTSGRTFALGSTDTQTRTLNTGASPGGLGSAARFVGKGSVALPIAAKVSTSLSAGGNVTARVLPTLGASGTLTYAQAAPGATTGSQGGGGVIGIINQGGSGNPPVGPTVRLRTTAIQTQSIAEQATGWSQTLGFASFDPRLGALWSVNLKLDTPIALGQAAENLSGRVGVVGFDQTAALALSLGDGAALAKTSRETRGQFALGAFDGAEDGAGPSGGTRVADGIRKVGARLFDGADFAAFSSPTGVDLRLSSTGTSTITGTNAFWVDLTALAGADVSLSYTYVVPAISSAASRGIPVAEPAAPALLVGAAFAVALARRRARRT